jgi:tetratricopeptide (TPR) repeat protein
VILELNQEQFFCKAELQTITGDRSLLWVQIDRGTASLLLEGKKPTYAICGLVANMYRSAESSFGLFSLVKLDFHSPFRTPAIYHANDFWTAYPGLQDLVNTAQGKCKALGNCKQWDKYKDFETSIPYQLINEIEGHINNRKYEQALSCVENLLSEVRLLPRVQFATGCIYYGLEQYEQALTHFNCSQRNGHLHAFERELQCHSYLTKPLRDRYPSVFDSIQRGEGSRALTTLRAATNDFPVTGNSVLAYCLRHSGNPEEGLAAASESLSLNPIQSDTLGHKWLFETELALDNPALATASDHITLYPLDGSAVTHCIDSLLLLDREVEAEELLDRYLITTTNYEHGLYYLFKVYEQSQRWEEAANRYETALRYLRSPTPDTLCKYGEILVELNRTDEALKVFDRALAITPDSADVILGYARALCRGGRESEAEELLQTVVQDPTRFDLLDGRSFLITLLAEIRRRCGRPAEAVATFNEYLDQDLVDLSEKVGPLPALEYIEALADMGNTKNAKEMLHRLALLWPEDPFVSELKDIIS